MSRDRVPMSCRESRQRREQPLHPAREIRIAGAGYCTWYNCEENAEIWMVLGAVSMVRAVPGTNQ